MNAHTANALAWISTAIAISVGVYVTGSLGALWAFFIPALLSSYE